MESLEDEFEQERSALMKEEMMLLSESKQLEAENTSLHQQLESAIEAGAQSISELKEHQSDVHAQMGATIDATAQLIDSAISKYNSEREAIREECVLNPFS